MRELISRWMVYCLITHTQVFIRPSRETWTKLLGTKPPPAVKKNEVIDWDVIWNAPLMAQNFSAILKLHGLVEIRSVEQKLVNNPHSIFMGFRNVRLTHKNAKGGRRQLNKLLLANGYTVQLDDVIHPTQLSIVPNDPLYATWQKENMQMINMQTAWGQRQRADGVTVCVIDTGDYLIVDI